MMPSAESDVDRFFLHLSECEKCGSETRSLLIQQVICPVGEELLFEAVDDLGERWQELACRIAERNQLAKGASNDPREW